MSTPVLQLACNLLCKGNIIKQTESLHSYEIVVELDGITYMIEGAISDYEPSVTIIKEKQMTNDNVTSKAVKLKLKEGRYALKLSAEMFNEVRRALATFPEYSVTKELERLVKLMEENGDVTKRMY